MAHFVYTNPKVVVNSVDLSDHTRSATLNYEAEIVDNTYASSDAVRRKLSGLKNWTISLEFAQDFSAGEVDGTLFSLIGSTDFLVTLRPVNTTRAATNPEFSGRGLLATYGPMGNSIGELAVTSPTIEGTGVLSRYTSST